MSYVITYISPWARIEIGSFWVCRSHQGWSEVAKIYSQSYNSRGGQYKHLASYCYLKISQKLDQKILKNWLIKYKKPKKDTKWASDHHLSKFDRSIEKLENKLKWIYFWQFLVSSNHCALPSSAIFPICFDRERVSFCWALTFFLSTFFFVKALKKVTVNKFL